MKKLVLLTVLMLFGIFAYAQSNAQNASYKWTTTQYDFGRIEQGKPATCEFVLKNTGKTPIVITNVSPTCGCTVPEYSKEPIAPGKTGIIKATYNAANAGAFNKTITVVLSNNVNEVLSIKGEVVPKTSGQ